MKHGVWLLIVCALVLFAACEPEAQEEATEILTEEPEAEESVEEEAQEEESVEEEESEEASPASKLAGLFANRGSIEFMVEYDATATVNGDSSSFTMTQYFGGVDRLRTDTTTGEGQNVRTYIVDDVLTSCTQAGEWNCLEMEMSTDPATEAQEKVEANPEDFDVSLLAPRTIAGTLAACFEVTVDEGSVEYCLSPSGVPLYIHSVGTASGQAYDSELIATSFSTSVPADAFTPPAEPTSFPSAGEEMTQEDLAALAAQYT